MYIGTRTYKCLVDDDDNPVNIEDATQWSISIWEVFSDGCESILDAWHIPITFEERAALKAKDDC